MDKAQLAKSSSNDLWDHLPLYLEASHLFWWKFSSNTVAAKQKLVLTLSQYVSLYIRKQCALGTPWKVLRILETQLKTRFRRSRFLNLQGWPQTGSCNV
eukprot:4841318-Amphidinium_carterae.1